MLGTPSERNWPGINQNQSFIEGNYPNYRPEKLHNHVPRIEIDGLDLLKKFVDYIPDKRITASTGMNHAYFQSLGRTVFALKDTDSIFTATELQLSKDPGFRASRPDTKGMNRRRLSVLF